MADDDDEQTRFSPAALRSLRDRAGMSQAALAEAAGVALRTITRFEQGDVEPRYTVALRLAETLDVDMAELAGETQAVDLAGQWYARWQTSDDSEPVITEQPVTLGHHGQRVPIAADRRGTVVGATAADSPWAGYRWEGEMRVSTDQTLIGSYVADDNGVRSRGSLYLVLSTSGEYMHGRWVGLSRDRLVTTGWGVIARQDDTAQSVMAHLLLDGRP